MLLEEVAGPEPILVFGKLCSGKGTFCKRYLDHGYTHIATSDVVKQISGASTRSQLHDTKSLDMEIAEALCNLIKQHDKIIIDGIRQLSIVKHIQQEFGENAVKLIWLEVPDEELKRRYKSRGDSKDDQEFEIALKRDRELGLDELEAHLKQRKDLMKVDHHYDGERDPSAY